MNVTGISEIDKYSQVVDHSILLSIADLAQKLSGIHIMHINTTTKGGGVAEILEALTTFFQGVGIKHSWQIVEIDETASPFMSKLIDQLQGGETGVLTQEEKDQFHCSLLRASKHLQQAHADMYFMHDLQLPPLSMLRPDLRPASWFCHMDIAKPNKSTEAYIQQVIRGYRTCAFNSSKCIMKNISAKRVHTIIPGIDPFKPRNKNLRKVKGLDLLAHNGIDINRPLITQVSRFDKWKNPWQVVDIYRVVKKEIPTVQLAFVGAMEAADDSTAAEVFADLRAYIGSDPDVHLFSDPCRIGQIEVNAFQRYSTVILQRSTREGFGLTVTEAMWKNQPVIGTSATGLQAQITDKHTGYIVDEVDQCAEYALQLIHRPALRRKLGQQAHEHVRKNFLVPMMALDYLKTVASTINGYSQLQDLDA